MKQVLDISDKQDLLREISELHKIYHSGDKSDLLYQWHLLEYRQQEALMYIASPDRASPDLDGWNEAAYSWEIESVNEVGKVTGNSFIISTTNVEIGKGLVEFLVLFSNDAKNFLRDRITLYKGK